MLVTASPRDAVTNAALGLRDVLRRVCRSEVYAHNIDEGVADEVHELSAYSASRRAGSPPNLLLYHASIGDPTVVSFLVRQPDRLALVYHNIAPAELFQAHDPGFARILVAGRQELRYLSQRAVMAIAVSSYNATELEALGYANVVVSPLVLELQQTADVEADPRTFERLDAQGTGPLLLFVGQLLPHKRPDLLVQAYHLLVTYFVPEARLVLVGAGRVPRYRDALHRQIEGLGLERAWLAGVVDDHELSALWRRATMFVTASEHEGFCIPLVEAMSCGVPVIAKSCAAIPDTVGDAALLLPADAGPEVMAEAMAELIHNADLHAELQRRGRLRASEFDADRARRLFVRNLLTMV